MIPTAAFTSKAELIAHYKAVNARLYGLPAPAKAILPPVMAWSERTRRRKLRAYVEKLRSAKILRERKRDALSRLIRSLPPLAVQPRIMRRRPADVIERTARRFGYGVEDIKGQRKDSQLIRARLACLEALDVAFPGRSLPWLGSHMDRDHTTILHSLRKLGRHPRK